MQKLSKSNNSNVANFGKEWSDYYTSLKKYYVEYARAYTSGNFSARPRRPIEPSTTGYTLITNASRKVTDSGMDRYYNDFSSVVNQKINCAALIIRRAGSTLCISRGYYFGKM